MHRLFNLHQVLMACMMMRPTHPHDAEPQSCRQMGAARCASSSGCEHETLSGLVHAFFECDDSDLGLAADYSRIGKSDSGRKDWLDQTAAAVRELVHGWRSPCGDPFRLRLLSDAVQSAAALRGYHGSAFRRAVMDRLREMGYNAGLCKARWERAGNLIAGTYEYIDVVSSAAGGDEKRYIVDLGFAEQFEVARAVEGYEKVVAELPEVLVALPEEVGEVVRSVGVAARRSLKAQGLHVPPWRKARYMMAKWLGPYRRTQNAGPVSVVDRVCVGGAKGKCCAN